MKSIELQWHSFNVSLPDVDTWIKNNTDSGYCGCLAGNQLSLWFASEPERETVQSYWDSLTSESAEAVNYVSAESLKTACDALRLGLASKSWDSMSIAERKLVLGQMPTKSELGL